MAAALQTGRLQVLQKCNREHSRYPVWHECCEVAGGFFGCKADLHQNADLCDELCPELGQLPCQTRDWACTWVGE